MATLNTTARESVGSLTLYIFNLTTVVDGETFASGLPNVVGQWATNGAGSASTQNAGVNVSNAAGTFTFNFPSTSGGDTIDLYVLSRT